MILNKVEVLLLVIAAARLDQSSSETVQITVPDGNVLGQVNTTTTNNVTYYNFRGIPYAQPPVGNLRFASPRRNSPWSGTWDATNDRNMCLQSADDTTNSTVTGDEDCLYINVYTPDINATNLPVLVWIYGGGFMGGSGDYAAYPPDLFLDQGLVYVSFNYRLGIMGFLSTEDEACPGNWGIKDQILALNWVQENIAYFGGSPGNVTVFGESAGAACVHLLLQTNRTEGLFERAIMNSGTTMNLWAVNTRAAETARLVANNLFITYANNSDLVAQLRGIDADLLTQTGSSAGWTLFFQNALRGLPYAPTVEPDIEGAVFVNPSVNALREGDFHKVPVLMGFNSEEAVIAGSIPSWITIYLSQYQVSVDLLTPWSITQNYFRRLFAGIDIRNEYFGLTWTGVVNQQLIKFISADQFNRPIRKAAGLMSNFTTVYFYQFGYEGNASNIYGNRTYSGTGHGEDVYFYFRQDATYSATDIEVSDKFVRLLTNFIKYGNPTPEEDESLDNILWKPVNSSDFNYLSFNEFFVLDVNPKQEDWEYYEELWDTYCDETDITTY